MWCMCGGCEGCIGLDALEAQARAEADAEVAVAEGAVADLWLDFDSLCRSFGDRAPGSIDEAVRQAADEIYRHYGLADA